MMGKIATSLLWTTTFLDIEIRLVGMNMIMISGLARKTPGEFFRRFTTTPFKAFASFQSSSFCARPPTRPQRGTFRGSGPRGNLARRRSRDLPGATPAHHVPCSIRDLDDVSLSTLGSFNHQVAALEEMLKRHIMTVDKVDYDAACRTFDNIEKTNHHAEYFMALPFQVGIVMCGAGAILAFPLVFHLPTVEYIN